MAYEFLDLGDADESHVALLTLRRERKKNALSMAMRDELEDALARLVANAAVHAVVLAGGEGIFCAGFDLKEGQESGGRAFLHRFREFFDACYTFPKPVVAAVDGPALAGGFDLALMADFIVASTRAVFGHPEIEFAPVAVAPLARFVPPARLRALCLLGEQFDAATAHAYGIVHEVVDPPRLLATATALAARLAAKPVAAVAATKRALGRASADAVTGDEDALRGYAIGRGAAYEDYVARRLAKT